MAMAMRRVESSQDLRVEMVRQTLQQDAAILEVIADSAPPQQTNTGRLLDITV
jgi:hypothetical protein